MLFNIFVQNATDCNGNICSTLESKYLWRFAWLICNFKHVWIYFYVITACKHFFQCIRHWICWALTAENALLQQVICNLQMQLAEIKLQLHYLQQNCSERAGSDVSVQNESVKTAKKIKVSTIDEYLLAKTPQFVSVSSQTCILTASESCSLMKQPISQSCTKHVTIQCNIEKTERSKGKLL